MKKSNKYRIIYSQIEDLFYLQEKKIKLWFIPVWVDLHKSKKAIVIHEMYKHYTKDEV